MYGWIMIRRDPAGLLVSWVMSLWKTIFSENNLGEIITYMDVEKVHDRLN